MVSPVSSSAGYAVRQAEALRQQSQDLAKTATRSTTQRAVNVLEIKNPRGFFAQKLDLWGAGVIKNNEDVKGQLTLQMQVLESIRDVLQKIVPSCSSIATTVDAGAAPALRQKAQEALGTVLSAVLTTYGDQYIFGGTDTSRAPVTSLIVAVDGTGSTNTSYDSTLSQNPRSAALRPDQSQSDLIEVTGCVSDDYIERTVQALNLARSGYFDKASIVGADALGKLIERIADVGAKVQHVENVNKAFQNEVDAVKEALTKQVTLDFDQLMASTEQTVRLQTARELTQNVQMGQWEALRRLANLK